MSGEFNCRSKPSILASYMSPCNIHRKLHASQPHNHDECVDQKRLWNRNQTQMESPGMRTSDTLMCLRSCRQCFHHHLNCNFINLFAIQIECHEFNRKYLIVFRNCIVATHICFYRELLVCRSIFVHKSVAFRHHRRL